MRRILVAAVVSALMLSVVPANAHEKLKVIGTDPALDAPPALDITELAVGRVGNDLNIQFIMTMLPVQGSYPGAGIEWTFDVGPRTFVAEGHPEGGGEFAYTLYEVVGGTFNEVTHLDGEAEWAEGMMTIKVPLSTIGARRGTRISGAGPKSSEDVDIHMHLEVASEVVDTLATTKDYVVP